MNSKPHIVPRKRPLNCRKAAMTIALGIACHKGIIVAADTQIAIGNAAQKASKMYLFKGKSGAFAIAFASEDANATRTLLNRIQRALQGIDCSDSTELETIICTEMTSWRTAWTVNPPAMQLVLASRLANDGARLYFCEPPNTFLQNTDGYVGIGTGAAEVTDTLNSTLFGRTHEYTDVQSALRRMAYLMYRAKKDNIFCGKSTYCGIVSWNSEEPIIVNHLDFEVAEGWASELDFLLHTTSVLYLGGAGNALKENAKGLADNFEGLASFRTVQFHGIGGQIIAL